MSWIPAVDICHRLSNISLKTKCWVLATQSHVIPIKISPYPGMSRLIFEFNAKLLRERKRGTFHYLSFSMTVGRMTQKDPKKSSSQAVNRASTKRSALPS